MASYPEPLQLAQDFNTVIVNGKIARRSDKMAKSLSGKVLKPGSLP